MEVYKLPNQVKEGEDAIRVNFNAVSEEILNRIGYHPWQAQEQDQAHRLFFPS